MQNVTDRKLRDLANLPDNLSLYCKCNKVIRGDLLAMCQLISLRSLFTTLPAGKQTSIGPLKLQTAAAKLYFVSNMMNGHGPKYGPITNNHWICKIQMDLKHDAS